MQGVVAGLPEIVCIAGYARLHMGFIDLHGGLGRYFGSVGLALDAPVTRLTAWRAVDCTADGPAAARACECALRFSGRAGIAGGVRMQLDEAIPDHAGLGSGTQMSLMVGTVMSQLYGLSMTTREIAAITGRGARSGIGIGAFDHGGFLVDGGRRQKSEDAANRTIDAAVPPVIARMDFPAEWRVLLVFDQRDQGVHGTRELEAFRDLPPFLPEQAAELSRRILMQALPALAEKDLAAFGEAIAELQRCNGEHFSPAQGGGVYSSAAVGQVMTWIKQQGVGCVGQSSWGPTGFAVVASETQASQLLGELQRRYDAQSGLRFMSCRARNTGSDIKHEVAGKLAKIAH